MRSPTLTEAESSVGSGEAFIVHAEEIRRLILMVSKTAIRDLDRRLDASGAGISGLQFGVMRLLNHESATISELSGRMMLAPATLVPVVDALERKGFVQRSSDPRDRRRNPLVLTENGLEVVNRVHFTSDMDSLAQGLLNLGEGKAQQLQTLLYELVNSLIADDALVDRALAMT